MYAVIFIAEIKRLDAEYETTASRMRDLAMEQYGCTKFTACTEADREIAISYWPSREHIKAWHNDPEHQSAQRLGRERWYKSYQVQTTKVLD